MLGEVRADGIVWEPQKFDRKVPSSRLKRCGECWINPLSCSELTTSDVDEIMDRKEKEPKTGRLRHAAFIFEIFIYILLFFPSWPDSTFLLQVLPHPFIRNKPGRCPATCPLYHFICFYMSLFVCPGQKCPAGGKGKIALSSTHASPVLAFFCFPFFFVVLCRDIWRTLLKDAFFVEEEPSEMSRSFRHTWSCELCAFYISLVGFWALILDLQDRKQTKIDRWTKARFLFIGRKQTPILFLHDFHFRIYSFIFSRLWVPTFKNFVYAKKQTSETEWWIIESDGLTVSPAL